MFHPARSAAWARALAFALAATLVASPALARSKKGHGRHRGHGYTRQWQYGSHHAHYAGSGHAYGRNVHHHHDHDNDVDELVLGLGLGAVGITALALLAQPRTAYYAPIPASPPPSPIDWNAYDDGVTVVSEGYDDRGHFCREFQKEIRVGGRVERGFGIACLQEDGSWRIGR
jgi:hypothetical protein